MKNYDDVKPRLKEIISHGLVWGLGEPKPGCTCVAVALDADAAEGRTP